VNLSCSVDVVDDRATVSLVGDVAMESTAVVREALQAAVARPGIATLIVDLSGVTFLDSSALGVLVAARKSAAQHGVAFSVSNPGPMVTMVLRITGLYDELVNATS